jgi:hypothetical protein
MRDPAKVDVLMTLLRQRWLASPEIEFMDFFKRLTGDSDYCLVDDETLMDCLWADWVWPTRFFPPDD